MSNSLLNTIAAGPSMRPPESFDPCRGSSSTSSGRVGAVRLVRRPRGRDQSVHVCLRAVARRVKSDWAGTCESALGACTAVQLVAAAVILFGPGHAQSPGAVAGRTSR